MVDVLINYSVEISPSGDRVRLAFGNYIMDMPHTKAHRLSQELRVVAKQVGNLMGDAGGQIIVCGRLSDAEENARAAANLKEV